MAVGHGGARPGAGRKTKRIKFAGSVGKLDKKLAAHVEKAAENLIKLADGGFNRGHEVWKPAGTIQITVTEIAETEHGPKVLRTLRPAFPELEDDEMVCVYRKVEIAEPDRAANEYIIDRIAGRPSQMEEPEDDKKSGAKVTEEARKVALEKMQAWRKTSQQQLDSIRNPLTGQNLTESEAEAANTETESGMTDEF